MLNTMKPVTVEVVSSANCPPCEAFERYWETLAKDWPNVTFKKTDIMTPEGAALAQKHMIMAAPGIIVNGSLVSVGGYDAKQFVETVKNASQE